MVRGLLWSSWVASNPIWAAPKQSILSNGRVRRGAHSCGLTILATAQYWGSMSGIGENYIMDQTNVRLREFSLTYSFPNSILGNSIVKGASISLIGQNLFFFYKGFDGGFDPEANLGTNNAGQGILYYSMPTARSFGFNLNVKF